MGRCQGEGDSLLLPKTCSSQMTLTPHLWDATSPVKQRGTVLHALWYLVPPSSHFTLAKALRFVLLERKKNSMTFVKDDQAGFIQDHGDWDPCSGIVQWEREMGLNSEYSMG